MSTIPFISRPYKELSTFVEHARNVSLFCISIGTTYTYLNYQYSLWMHGSNFFELNLVKNPYEYLYPTITLYALIDMYFSNTYEMKIHHLFIMGIYFYNNYYNVSPDLSNLFGQPLLNTEISSLFFVLKGWLPINTPIYNANLVLFIVTFFKYRIWDFYYQVIYQHANLEMVFKKYSHDLSTILYVSFYGLFILNIYWWFAIMKNIYKVFLKNTSINSDIVNYSLSRYIGWANTAVSLYVYTVKDADTHARFFFEKTSIQVLSMFSHIYHEEIYDRLMSKKIDSYDVPTENMMYFGTYIYSLQQRSFFAVFSNYYKSDYFYFNLIMSGTFHVYSLYYSHLNRIFLALEKDEPDYKTRFLTNQKVIVFIPLLCDTIMIYLNSPNETAIPLSFTFISMVLLFILEPFYKLTNVAFLVSLIIQTYWIGMSNYSNI